MKLIIAGGRDFADAVLLCNELNKLVAEGIIDESVELVCGMARGADMLGYHAFKDQDLPIHEFHPDWNGLGKRAGFVRNADMGNAADYALIFWDGKSKGTKHMIDFMVRVRKPHRVVSY